MKRWIQAAYGTNTGRIRKNNEDNVCFDGYFLDADHGAAIQQTTIRGGTGHIAVFDGMGGENYGELASYAAAKSMATMKKSWSDQFHPWEWRLNQLITKLNQAVLAAKEEAMTTRMGTTMVSLCFAHRNVYVSNIGDSRAYRLRDGELCQLSVDHVASRPRRPGGKPPLTQHLGIDPEDMLIEPYIMKHSIQPGDVYLLCSDGLTDMLTDLEITDIMQNNEVPAACVDQLIDTALEHGGRDNITVVICRMPERRKSNGRKTTSRTVPGLEDGT